MDHTVVTKHTIPAFTVGSTEIPLRNSTKPLPNQLFQSDISEPQLGCGTYEFEGLINVTITMSILVHNDF